MTTDPHTHDPALLDRAEGAVLGSAVGDALGAGYEFDHARPGPEGPRMIGGGPFGFAPGEWTDDTTMAWCVLDAAAGGQGLHTTEGLDRVAARFVEWSASDPKDMGAQTRTVLSRAATDPTAAGLRRAADELHARTGRTGGNGSLMRTGPVALPYLSEGEEARCAEAARSVSLLTHPDPRAGEACVLWSLAVRNAVRTGTCDIRVGLPVLDVEARDFWGERIAEAESRAPGSFRPNGYVVTAFQAAWAALSQTPVPEERPERHLVDALGTAIGIGDDTDTVAAIAGSLLGARWGASAVPAEWRRVCHGYPGLDAEGLLGLVRATVG